MTQNSLFLYERLGGVYGIAAVVDDFIDRIMVNLALNANAKVDEAHPPRVEGRFQISGYRNGLLGHRGPQKYTSESMRESHEHLAITEPEWQVFLQDFQDSLDKFQVPLAEQRELFAIVASTKRDIVVPKSPLPAGRY